MRGESRALEPFETFDPFDGPTRRAPRRGPDIDPFVKICHETGLSQNETARQLEVSRHQVRMASIRLGLVWGEAPVAATAAAIEYARRERLGLMQRWHDFADQELEAAESAINTDDQHSATIRAAIATDKVVALAKLHLLETAERDDNRDSQGRFTPRPKQQDD